MENTSPSGGIFVDKETGQVHREQSRRDCSNSCGCLFGYCSDHPRRIIVDDGITIVNGKSFHGGLV
jgi:hypothetical protein